MLFSFKILLWIIAVLFSLFAIILLTKITVIITYKDKLGLYIKFWHIFQIDLLKILDKPKVKKVKIDSEKKKRKKDIIEKESTIKKTEKPKPSKKLQKIEKKTEKKTDKKDIKEILSLIKEAINSVLKPFFRYLKVKVARINICVGGEESAEIAILYGGIQAALGSLYAILINIPNFSLCEKNFSVKADFLSKKTYAEIDLRFSIYIWQVVVCLLKALIIYFKASSKFKVAQKKG